MSDARFTAIPHLAITFVTGCNLSEMFDAAHRIAVLLDCCVECELNGCTILVYSLSEYQTIERNYLALLHGRANRDDVESSIRTNRGQK